MKMKKLTIIALLLLITMNETFAYAIKVYDEWGNRIGTYKKEGENFVLYDFYDKKVENPENLIKNPPNNRLLKEYSQYFYDENMNPIGGYSTGLWWNHGRFYPGRRYMPRCFNPPCGRSIVRPSAKNIIYEERFPYGRINNKIPVQKNK